MLEHRAIAEEALGRPLPDGAVVHHVDDNGKNNAPNNLVICNSHAHHMEIHRRQDAQDACGNANWLYCKYCKTHDDPDNDMHSEVQTDGRFRAWHRSCYNQYQNERYRVKRAALIAAGLLFEPRRRQIAFEACGNPDWYKCHYCKEWEPPDSPTMYVKKRPNGSIQSYHRSCNSIYVKNLRTSAMEQK